MNAGRADAIKWFFCFRQTFPRPPGRWVVQGPFHTYERAQAERNNAKAWDAEVSMLFEASTKDEAQRKCDTDPI